MDEYERKNAELDKHLQIGYSYIIQIQEYDGNSYDILNELLLWDGEYEGYVWENDWYEGQEFDFIGFIKIDDVTGFTPIKKEGD